MKSWGIKVFALVSILALLFGFLGCKGEEKAVEQPAEQEAVEQPAEPEGEQAAEPEGEQAAEPEGEETSGE
jgi:hypothetical protein